MITASLLKASFASIKLCDITLLILKKNEKFANHRLSILIAKRKYISHFVILLSVIIALLSGLSSGKWKEERVIISDGKIYYSYLPALFIYGDLTFDKSPGLIALYGKNWRNTAPNGNKVVKMTMGNALCWSPFFGIGHLVASAGDERPDGFSPPYHLMILIAGSFYLLLGLLFLRKLLLIFFDDVSTAITLAILVFGTNLFYYAAYEPQMSHVNSFFIITLFLYLTVKWFDQRTTGRSLLTGLSLGLVMLIRPTNAIIVLIPLLFWLTQFPSWKSKFKFIRENIKSLLLVILSAVVAFAPQMIYWQIQSGSIIYNSYHEEGFFFSNPHILDGLFSYRKGWLLYSPLMVLGFVGLFFMKNKSSALRIPIIISTLVFIYIIFSWWCWWYGGSYGSRAMIDIYGVLAIPVAALIQYLISRRIWIRGIAALAIGFLIYLNLFQISQYRNSMLHFDGMTKEAYWTLFLEDSWPDNYNTLIKRPDYEKALKGMD